MGFPRSCLAALAAVLILTASCDEVDYRKARENVVREDPDTVSVAEIPVRRSLIFDFTGQTCGNCPAGHRIAENLVEQYHDTLVYVMGIHCGYFATPRTGWPDDYRTVIGNNLDEYYGASAAALPRGVINGDKASRNSPTAWNGQVAAAQTLPAPATALSVHINGGKVKVNVTQTEAAPEGYQLNLYVLRDSIQGVQLDYSRPSGDQEIDPYYHRHVLRDSALLVRDFVPAGYKGNKARTYLINFPDQDKPWRNEIVATLTDANRKVVQVAKAKQKTL